MGGNCEIKVIFLVIDYVRVIFYYLQFNTTVGLVT